MEAKKILKSRISSSVSWTTGTNHQRLSPRHRCFTARREVHITNTSNETLLSQAVPKVVVKRDELFSLFPSKLVPSDELILP